MQIQFSLFGQKAVGQIREHNEDDFVICQNLSQQDWQSQPGAWIAPNELGCILAVADGMGGTRAGEIASEIAIREVRRFFNQVQQLPASPGEALREVIHLAHDAIVQHGKTHPETRGMGTTLVLAWVVQGHYHIAWCGDSRAYLYRKEESFAPLTDDHSLVWEMVMAGSLSPEQARLHPDSNIITQSLGTPQTPPRADLLPPIPCQVGDRFLLCSDGLNGMLSDPQIETIIAGQPKLPQCGKRLIAAANAAGGHDNITLTLLEIAEDQREASAQQTNKARKSWLPWVSALLVGSMLLSASWLPIPATNLLFPTLLHSTTDCCEGENAHQLQTCGTTIDPLRINPQTTPLAIERREACEEAGKSYENILSELE